MPPSKVALLLTLTACCEVFRPCPVHGAVERIVESFDGTGEFDSAESVVASLDNPGWFISGNGTLENGGYSFMNSPAFDEGEDHEVERIVLGQGGFVSRMEVRDLNLGEIGDDGSRFSWVRLLHVLGERHKDEILNMALQETPRTNSSNWVLGMHAGADPVIEFVPRGNHVAMQIEFDAATSLATFSYDNDIHDAIAAISFDLEYAGAVRDSHLMSMTFNAFNVQNSGILDSYTLTPLDIQGDFNRNDALDTGDIDLLTTEVQAATHDLFFDLNNDSLVDALDRTIWVHDLANTFFGDANLNAEFNSADLVNVFQAAEYEDNVPLNSTWFTGDWNGDAEFDSADLVLAFQDGGYETGPRAAATAVPEPTSTSWLLLFSWLLACSRQVRARSGSPC